jgi:hypothetical protein
MSNRGPRAVFARLVIVLVVGGLIAIYLYRHGTPLTISEPQVRSMIASKELIGLTLEDAATRLQHTPTNTYNGRVYLDFHQVTGWTAGPVVLYIVNGRVSDAYWAADHKDEE